MNYTHKSEVATILTIATVVFIGLSIFIPTFFVKNKNIIKSHAQESACNNGGWWCAGECADPEKVIKPFTYYYGQEARNQWFLEKENNILKPEGYCKASLACNTWFCNGECAKQKDVDHFMKTAKLTGGDLEDAKKLWYSSHESYNNLDQGSCENENKRRPIFKGEDSEIIIKTTLSLKECLQKIKAPCADLEGCGGSCNINLNSGCGYGGCHSWERCSPTGTCLWKEEMEGWKEAEKYTCAGRVGVEYTPLKLSVCQVETPTKKPSLTYTNRVSWYTNGSLWTKVIKNRLRLNPQLNDWPMIDLINTQNILALNPARINDQYRNILIKIVNEGKKLTGESKSIEALSHLISYVDNNRQPLDNIVYKEIIGKVVMATVTNSNVTKKRLITQPMVITDVMAAKSAAHDLGLIEDYIKANTRGEIDALLGPSGKDVLAMKEFGADLSLDWLRKNFPNESDFRGFKITIDYTNINNQEAVAQQYRDSRL